MEEYSYFQFHYIEGSRAKKGWGWAGLGAGLGVITSSNSFNNSRKSQGRATWSTFVEFIVSP